MASAAARLIKAVTPLGFAWPAMDPFLFCVWHLDHYPASSASEPDLLGPERKFMRGRDIGQDFQVKDGFRYYHGTLGVPGFPVHPHFGFETITVVRQGLIDHTDSLGAVGRYGEGDLQWLTTGSGVRHCEMFPCVHRDKPNTCELFQIWLNLPGKSKMAPPAFVMNWAHQQPRRDFGEPGKSTHVHVAAGALAGLRAPPGPPHSWGTDEHNYVTVATIRMQPNATWVLPRVEFAPGDSGPINRMLYVFRGNGVRVGGQQVIKSPTGVELAFDRDALLENVGGDEAEMLLLQGRPIGEPVVQRGPFVAVSQAQLRDGIMRYQETEFGDWPAKTDEPVHPREQTRFARYPDGRVVRPEDAPAFDAGNAGKAGASERKEDL